jgi:hypothetical protein
MLRYTFLNIKPTTNAHARGDKDVYMCMMVSSSTGSSISHQVVRNVKQERIVIHWFRNTDLRLLDNDALTHSSLLAKGDESIRRCKVLPIYCFDTSRTFGTKNTVTTSSSSSTQRWKCSPRRAQFIIESVLDVRRQLQETYHSQLLIGVGNPADIFEQVLSQLVTDTSRHHQQVSTTFQKHWKEFHPDTKVELYPEIVCQDEPAYEERQQVQDVTTVLTKYYPLFPQVKRIQRIWELTWYKPHKMPYDSTFAVLFCSFLLLGIVGSFLCSCCRYMMFCGLFRL